MASLVCNAQKGHMLQVIQVRGGGTEIWLGGLAGETAKQPIIRAKRLRAMVKNWRGAKAPGSAALDSGYKCYIQTQQ